MSEIKMHVSDKQIEFLIEEALKVRQNAYAPYSNYKVGAALLSKDNKIYSGANIENASFPAGICAERSALVKAITDNKFEFSAIVIIGAPDNLNEPKKFAFPCGVCRQFMAEFFDKDTKIIVAKSIKEYRIYNFDVILPYSFGKINLEN